MVGSGSGVGIDWGGLWVLPLVWDSDFGGVRLVVLPVESTHYQAVEIRVGVGRGESKEPSVLIIDRAPTQGDDSIDVKCDSR